MQRFSYSSCPPALSTSRAKRELNLNSAFWWFFLPPTQSCALKPHEHPPEGFMRPWKSCSWEVQSWKSLSRLLISLANGRSMQHLIRLLKEGPCLTPRQQDEREKYPTQTEPWIPPPPVWTQSSSLWRGNAQSSIKNHFSRSITLGRVVNPVLIEAASPPTFLSITRFTFSEGFGIFLSQDLMTHILPG